MDEPVKILKKMDIVLMVAMLLSAVGLIFIFTVTAGEVGYVRVSFDGQVEYFSLAEYDGQQIEIVSERGTNIIFIDGGTVRIANASCPDHLCVNWGAISASWHSLTCRPNHVAVTLVGREEEERFPDLPPLHINTHQ